MYSYHFEIKWLGEKHACPVTKFKVNDSATSYLKNIKSYEQDLFLLQAWSVAGATPSTFRAQAYTVSAAEHCESRLSGYFFLVVKPRQGNGFPSRLPFFYAKKSPSGWAFHVLIPVRQDPWSLELPRTK